MIKRVEVKNQAELDKAVSEGNIAVIIASGHYVAWGNSSVVARGNSSVVARGNSSVEAWENSSVEAWGNSSVVARGNSSVEAWENSSVEAWGNSSVEAWENSSVVARGNSSVEAWGASCVRVKGWGEITASTFVTVYIFNPKNTQISGGHQIIIPRVTTAHEWAEWHGLQINEDGGLTVYKAVDDSLRSPHGATYAIGQEVIAEDWEPRDCCGHGLHFSATPREAQGYFNKATRFLACRINASETTVITSEEPSDKVKARSCFVLGEVDIKGNPVSHAKGEGE